MKPIGLLVGAALTLAAQYPASRHGGNYMFNYYLPPAPSTTPWAPAWSPDGKWIAVAIEGSIWKVDPETGAATELTYNRKYHSSPAFSPDGKWIVYTADDDGRSIQLEILNLATGEASAVTDDKHLYLDPVFSPDGRRLACVSTRPNGYFNIYVRAIRDGRWDGEPVALTSDHRYPRDRLYFGPWDMHTQPAWTPDGKEILFVSNRGVPLGSGDLWRMPAEPDGMAKAAPVLREQTLYRTRPHVSPDGKRVLYSSTAGAADQFDNLYVVPLAGGAPYKLTFGSYDHFHPRWSPDGEWIAYISNEEGLPQLGLLETYGGARKRIRIAARRWKRPMGRVHVRVVDERGAVTAARIHGLAADGKFYAPADAYARIGGSGEHVFHTAGEFTLEVPPGKMTLTAVKGFEHRPTQGEVEVKPEETARLTLTLRRVTDFAAKGWRGGSTHVHTSYGGNLRHGLEDLMLMSRAEGQEIVCALVANKDNRVLDWQHFVPGGGEHPVSQRDPAVKVIVGEEYRPPFWGHVFLLGLKDHLISPFTTGYEGTAIESLYPSNTDMFRKAKAQGAVTGYVHAFGGERDPLEGGLGVAKAFPVDAALGTVDALEWSQASRAQLAVWHHALNNDLPIWPAGGEDSITDLHRGKLIGSVRTYAFLDKEFSVAAWLEALRKGRTFFTTGPLLEFRVNGRLPGDAIRLAAAGGTVTLEGSVTSIAPLEKVVIYANGRALKQLSVAGAFRERVPLTESTWFSLYAEGPPYRFLDGNYLQAATNAIRVYVGEQPIRNRASAEYFIRWIDKLSELASQWPWWRSEREKQHVLAQFAEARRVYQSR
ncbi:MAG: CehA/McbA family metallohydrolase [Acidobacteriota bacterium]